MAIAGKVACTPKGEWATGMAYEIIDIVKHNNASWLSRKDNNVTEPSEGAGEDWLLLAKDGTDGTDGYSPTVATNKVGRISTVTITDESGAHEFEVIDGVDGTDGTDGEDGADGVSPTVTTSRSGKVTTITITDKDGDHVVTINDGEDGDGSGDMLKSVYDRNNNGIVDEAEKVEFEGVQNIPYDTTPTENSDKLMKSKDIKAALDLKGDKTVLDGKGDTLVYDEDNSKLKMYSGGKEGTLLSEVTIEGGGGGLKIGDVSGATISSHMTTVSLKWSDPNDIIADGTPLVEWGGTLLVRKEGSAPTGRDDGTVIIDNKTRNAYSETALTDTNVEYGKTYYYRFFTYSKTGSYTAGTSLSVTPSRVVIENDPVQSGTLTYDGTEKTASFSNFDDTKMSVSGNTGTNAGSYTAVFTLNEGYCWSNGSTDAKEVTWTIGNAVISAVPSVSAPLIWTGEELSPTWSGYDPDKLDIGGDTAGTDTGTYTAEFTPKTNYEWWDGSREAKEATWAIVLTIIENVPVQSGSLTYNGEAQAPTWINYDETKMSKTETAQTNAGDYSTTFTPLSGYCWPNGSVEGKVIEWSIAKDKLTVPTLNAYNFIYDGTEKEVTFANYSGTTMTKSGHTATAAGDHTATIGIANKDNYEWSDETTEDKTYPWSIAKASLTIPTVNSEVTLVYTGGIRNAAFNDYAPSKMDVTGDTGTDAGDYTAVFSLKDTANYQWSGGSVADQSVNWKIEKANASIIPENNSVTLNSSNTSQAVALTVVGESSVTASSSDTSVATAAVSGNSVTISSVNDTTGTAVITLSMAESSNYKAASAQINVTCSFVQAYGVEWDGTSTTALSRTGLAADFIDPVPAVNNGSGSSPFDNILPWSGIEKVEDAEGGTLVKIPKYYYKWTRNGAKMGLQISDVSFSGSHVSPAHADRGDGKGERDYVYVGRYHCADSNYKSKTGEQPKANTTRANFRTAIHALGSTIWQYDFAMFWTIAMLYLVEFADWNSQAKIGYGCSPDKAKANMGGTDAMQYHTGTSAENRETYGWTQYRYIEGLWDNVYDWCDGIYFSGADVYAIKNPADFSDTEGGTKISTRPTSSNYIKAWAEPEAEGFEYALYPSEVGGSGSTYIPDYCYYNASGVVLLVGGNYYQFQDRGLFCLSGSNAASNSYANIGSRLQKLP